MSNTVKKVNQLWVTQTGTILAVPTNDMESSFWHTDLAGCAVGQACLIIGGQVEVSWAGTLVTPTRRE